MTPRRLAAGASGLVIGLAILGLLLGVGYLLWARLFGSSWAALLVISIGFGSAGAYAGWLGGVIVFSAVRGSRDPETEGMG